MSPLYLYRCSKGHETEEIFSFGKRVKQIPCHCGKKAAKIIVFPAAIFKGQGFTRSHKQPVLKDQNPKQEGAVTEVYLSNEPAPAHELMKQKPTYYVDSGKKVLQ